MYQIQYKGWVWPDAPEQMDIQTRVEPIYTVDAEGVVHFIQMGEMSRTIVLRGVFQGTGAYVSYQKLEELIATGTAGELQVPVLGSIPAYLTRLHMDQQSRTGYVVYEATFRQTNVSGGVPPRVPQIAVG